MGPSMVATMGHQATKRISSLLAIPDVWLELARGKEEAELPSKALLVNWLAFGQAKHLKQQPPEGVYLDPFAPRLEVGGVPHNISGGRHHPQVVLQTS